MDKEDCMKRFEKACIITLSLFVLIGGGLTAQSVVASTAWTGAFARVAGADEVRVLAPFDLSHPPEYELRPSDIRTVMNADLVIYAGYENMVERLVEAAGQSDAETIQIQTIHSVPVMTRSVLSIARALGTEETAGRNLDRLVEFLDEWSREVGDYEYDGQPVVAHFHQQALARQLGMNVVGVFGPAPLEARQIDELTRMEPALIIDNGHNPVAEPIAETTQAAVSVWYNFPGIEGTRTLMEIFELNRAAFRDTVQ